jgi:Aldehyde oxidase and xanthine dehydrogenase, a/b hammerhead domain
MTCRTSPEVGGMGHPIKRKEDLRFIQGKGNYVDDVQLPDMVYGHMVRSPYAHARLKGVNTEKAKQLPGVLAVITGEDLAKANLAWMPTLFFDKQMVLATGKVLFQSQEVAFVVAEDPIPLRTQPSWWKSIMKSCRCWSIPTRRSMRMPPFCVRIASKRAIIFFTGRSATGPPPTRYLRNRRLNPACMPSFSAAIPRRLKPAVALRTSIARPSG